MFRPEHVKDSKMTKGGNMALCLQPGLHFSFGNYFTNYVFSLFKRVEDLNANSSQPVAAAMTAMLIACASALFANCVFLAYVGRSVYLKLYREPRFNETLFNEVLGK